MHRIMWIVIGQCAPLAFPLYRGGIGKSTRGDIARLFWTVAVIIDGTLFVAVLVIGVVVSQDEGDNGSGGCYHNHDKNRREHPSSMIPTWRCSTFGPGGRRRHQDHSVILGRRILSRCGGHRMDGLFRTRKWIFHVVVVVAAALVVILWQCHGGFFLVHHKVFCLLFSSVVVVVVFNHIISIHRNFVVCFIDSFFRVRANEWIGVGFFVKQCSSHVRTNVRWWNQNFPWPNQRAMHSYRFCFQPYVHRFEHAKMAASK